MYEILGLATPKKSALSLTGIFWIFCLMMASFTCIDVSIPVPVNRNQIQVKHFESLVMNEETSLTWLWNFNCLIFLEFFLNAVDAEFLLNSVTSGLFALQYIRLCKETKLLKLLLSGDLWTYLYCSATTLKSLLWTHSVLGLSCELWQCNIGILCVLWGGFSVLGLMG